MVTSRLLPIRRCVQIAVLLVLAGSAVLNMHRVHILYGNLLSFNLAGFPFADPLAALQAVLATLDAPARVAWGACSALVLALLLGPVFCGWLCPFGLCSELVYRFRNGKKNADTRTNIPIPKKALVIKTALMLAGLVIVLAVGASPWLNQLSLPGWISRAIQQAVLYREFAWGALLVAAVLIVEGIAGKRLWCRYICPQSVLLVAASAIFPARLQVTFTPSSCTCPAKDRICMTACTLHLNPRKPGTAQRLQCNNCGDCVAACSGRGKALRYACGKQSRK